MLKKRLMVQLPPPPIPPNLSLTPNKNQNKKSLMVMVRVKKKARLKLGHFLQKNLNLRMAKYQSLRILLRNLTTHLPDAQEGVEE